MDVQLTKETKEFLVAVYDSYLQKRKSGTSRDDAKYCNPIEIHQQYFPAWNLDDIRSFARELCRKFRCKAYLDGSFILSDDLLIYMENRFKNGIKDTLSFLSQFK